MISATDRGVLASGLVKVQSREAHGRHNGRQLSPLLCRGYFVPFCVQQGHLFRNAEDLRGCVLVVGGQSFCSEGCQVCEGFIVEFFFLMISEHPACDETRNNSTWLAQSTSCGI